jgi:hypothetical protein
MVEVAVIEQYPHTGKPVPKQTKPAVSGFRIDDHRAEADRVAAQHLLESRYVFPPGTVYPIRNPPAERRRELREHKELQIWGHFGEPG